MYRPELEFQCHSRFVSGAATRRALTLLATKQNDHFIRVIPTFDDRPDEVHISAPNFDTADAFGLLLDDEAAAVVARFSDWPNDPVHNNPKYHRYDFVLRTDGPKGYSNSDAMNVIEGRETSRRMPCRGRGMNGVEPCLFLRATYHEMQAWYALNPQHRPKPGDDQRLGQRFCNHFNFRDSELFTTEDVKRARHIISGYFVACVGLGWEAPDRHPLGAANDGS